MTIFEYKSIELAMDILNRRNFLKSYLIGAGGVVLAQPAIASAIPAKSGAEVQKRVLGKTGLEIPVVSMGVMRADSPNLVKASLDAGVVLFDTANGYQDGQNETMLGQVFKDVPRDKFILETKVKSGGSGGNTDPVATKKAFLEKFETSLGRLQLDYVDILLLHGARSAQDVLHEPVLEALQQAKREGKTRFIGVSTHSNEPEVIRAAIETGVLDVILVSYNFKHDLKDEISSAMADASKAGIGIIGMKTMAGMWLDKAKTKAVDPKAALKWALQDPHLTTCIPGYTTFDQMEMNLEVLTDTNITPEELEKIGMASNEMGLYCQGCTQCLDQCKKGLPVPDIMRSYMYAYGYGEMQKARDTMDEYQVDADPCRDCSTCTVSCMKGFPIAERIADVCRIKEVPKDFIV